MRIERVIGRTFQEASEITKRKYGIDCLVLSTNKVAGSTEMLVALESESSTQRPAAAQPAQFVAATPVRTEAPAAPASIASTGEGSRMVEAIRAELVALEKRLAQIGEAGDNAALKMSLIGLGASASYVNAIAGDSTPLEKIAEKISHDLALGSLFDLSNHKPLLIVGPSGSGKTTVSMQAAATLVRGDATVPARVASLRDARVGSRDRFFALADAAGHEAHWGSFPADVQVIDSGGLDIARVTDAESTIDGRQVVVCLPSHMNRMSAQRWLMGGPRPAGVVISHWDASMVPAGLLSMLAELKVPLLAVSSQAHPAALLDSLATETIRLGLEQVMKLIASQAHTKVA